MKLVKKKIELSDPSTKDLTEAEQKQVKEMKQTDQEVKTHERAHQSAASGINAGAASYDTKKAPDGKEYAVAGEVELSFTPSSDPEQNIRMAEAMRRAALAPAEPSAQDRKVAQHANQLINQYRQEMQQDRIEENNSNREKQAQNSEQSNDSSANEDASAQIFAGNKDVKMPEIGGEKLKSTTSAKQDVDNQMKHADKNKNVISMDDFKNANVTKKSSAQNNTISKNSSNNQAQIEQAKPSVSSSQASGLSKETVFIEKIMAHDDGEGSQPDVTLV